MQQMSSTGSIQLSGLPPGGSTGQEDIMDDTMERVMLQADEKEQMLRQIPTDDLDVESLYGRGLTQKQFDLKYGRIKEKKRTCRETIQHFCDKRCQRSKGCCASFLLSQFPFVNVIRSYRFKEYVLGDLLSGLSLGVMNIPQSLGYALLATVAPIYGLYTAFFAPLIYVIFGTSHHIAMGVMALSSLLIADVINRETFALQEEIEQSSGNDTNVLEGQLAQESIDIAVLLTILSGIFSFLMGVFHLGFITDYMGDAFVSGWLTGTNIRVLTSQVIQLLQLKPHAHVGPFSYFKTLVDIFQQITEANVAAVVIAAISLAILLPVKYGVNEKFKSKLKVPIPIDLMVVIAAILACYFGGLKEKYGVRLVDNIPTGLPVPRLPPLARTPDLLVDAFLLSLVGYVLGYMMVKVFADKYNYPVCPNQELKALGMCNIIGGFFSSIACSTSPPRCFFMEQTGGKTQLANVISAIITLMFLFFAGPALEPMPTCVLNVLIIVACIPIFEYYKRCVIFWRTNKYDFAIWCVSALATVCWDVNMGIMVGMSFSLFTVVFRTQRPYSASVSPVEGSTRLVDGKKYSKHLTVIPGVKILCFSSPLYFSTLEQFRVKLFSVAVNPADVKARRFSPVHDLDDEKEISDNPSMEEGMNTPLTKRKLKTQISTSTPLKHIIIDASSMPFMDTAGAKLLAQYWVAYANVGITLALAACNEEVRAQFRRVPQCHEFWDSAAYPSVEDALMVLG